MFIQQTSFSKNQASSQMKSRNNTSGSVDFMQTLSGAQSKPTVKAGRLTKKSTAITQTKQPFDVKKMQTNKQASQSTENTTVSKVDVKEDKDIKKQNDQPDSEETPVLSFLSVQLGISTEKLQDLIQQLGLVEKDLLGETGLKTLLDAVQINFPMVQMNKESLLVQVQQYLQQQSQDAVVNAEQGQQGLPEITEETLVMLTQGEIKQPQTEKKVAFEGEKAGSSDVLDEEKVDSQIDKIDSTIDAEHSSAEGQETSDKTNKGMNTSAFDLITERRVHNQDPNANAYSLMDAQTIFSRVHKDKTQADVVNSQPVANRPLITPEHLIEQIAQKIDIHVEKNHSEVKMHLKPESLGNLVLKIEIEKGIVTAKFMVESQQVKEVLESNFKQLQDSLEKQGLQVQQIDVSIGGESAEHQQQFLQQHANKIKRAVKSTGDDSIDKIYGEFIEDEVHKENPYLKSENQVDFTA